MPWDLNPTGRKGREVSRCRAKRAGDGQDDEWLRVPYLDAGRRRCR